MSTKGELAKHYFTEGYNCSQAVLLAFADDLGIDKKTAVMISSGFGGGMGRMREVCGAVSGMFMVIGMKYGYDNPKNFEAKRELYKKIQEIAEEFKKENGSIICRELLGLSEKEKSIPTPEKRTSEYYKKRPCPELVKLAADLTEDYLKRESKRDK